ncbi:relaxin-3-like [Mauremys mutica]|uniref:relaxin-3-like n=1 Tax=Mauremys mutica TaxID=74926 RepID=UPI001D16245C|nr:relaxin-3-like [Mauremys mutica]
MGMRLRVLCAGLLLAGLPAELGAQGAPDAAAVPRGGGGAGPGGEYGVKLCGREFIRAVIFTCGGSRWKRLALQAEEPLPGADSSQATSNKELENLKLQSFLGPGLEQLQRASVPLGQLILKDLFSLYDYNEYVPMSDDFSEYVRQVEDAAWKNRGGTGIANPMRSNSFPWAKYPRRKRDFSMGVAGVCCKWGCTKAEISTLC